MQKKDKSKKETNVKNEIEVIKKELQKLKINPNFKENLDLTENLKKFKQTIKQSKN